MSAREEIAGIYVETLNNGHGVIDRPEQGLKAADAILAAGYQKPRTVSTVAELDALPAWSVLRSEQATIWEKFGGIRTGDFWAETMTLGKHPSDHIALPATVLYEPTP